MKSVSTLVTAAVAITLATAGLGMQSAAAQPAVVAGAAPVYVVAVGDIACDPSPVGDPNYSQSYNAGNGTLNGCRQKAVGAAVMAAQPDQFWALGDNQYFNGTYAKYMEVYDKAFGALKGITHPIRAITNGRTSPSRPSPARATSPTSARLRILRRTAPTASMRVTGTCLPSMTTSATRRIPADPAAPWPPGSPATCRRARSRAPSRCGTTHCGRWAAPMPRATRR